MSDNIITTQTWKIGDCIELMQEIDDEYIDLKWWRHNIKLFHQKMARVESSIEQFSSHAETGSDY